jgi:hypothetical protein
MKNAFLENHNSPVEFSRAGGVLDAYFGIKNFNIHQSALKSVPPSPLGSVILEV